LKTVVAATSPRVRIPGPPPQSPVDGNLEDAMASTDEPPTIVLSRVHPMTLAMRAPFSKYHQMDSHS
jgi:hypothetical protein